MVYHISIGEKTNEIAKGLIRMPMSIQDKEAEALSDKSKT